MEILFLTAVFSLPFWLNKC